MSGQNQEPDAPAGDGALIELENATRGESPHRHQQGALGGRHGDAAVPADAAAGHDTGDTLQSPGSGQPGGRGGDAAPPDSKRRPPPAP
jgi:hypothetical protein